MPTTFYLKYNRISTYVGVALFILLVWDILPNLGLIAKLFLFAPLVIAPLAFNSLAEETRQGTFLPLYKAVVLAQPFCAIATLIAFTLPQGMLAGGFASLWLLLTLMALGLGLQRWLPRGLTCKEEMFIDLSLVYFAVGGVWLVLNRMGIHPMKFDDAIVLLTAIHFHYAGFAACFLLGLVGRLFKDATVLIQKIYYLSGFLIISGIPLLAIGIAFSHFFLEVMAASALAFSLIIFSLLIFLQGIKKLKNRISRTLLTIAAGSLIFSMALSILYALREMDWPLQLNILQMAKTHGLLNSFGFAFCGLLAFTLEKPQPRTPPYGIPFSSFYSFKKIGPDFFQRIHAINKKTTHPPPGIVDSMDDYQSEDFNPAGLDSKLRSFYEKTNQYSLVVEPHWTFGFKFIGKIYRQFADQIGQMALPTSLQRDENLIESKIVSLDDNRDGRNKVRAWIRTYANSKRAVYIAAYANHSDGRRTYMNIAFPVIGGNVTSILRAELSKDRLRLTSLHSKKIGDEGVYFASPLFFAPIRLPINETIEVWTTPTAVMAQHDMWFFDIKFLTLNYSIYPIEG